MIYLEFLLMMGLVVGLIAVASNPSPYYAAFGLVLAAICGCCMLVKFGISFLSLVLLLIYLGGMLVVFAYSASLAAEPYPEAWGNLGVLMYVCFYILLLISFSMILNLNTEFLFPYHTEINIIGKDWGGVGMMYVFGNIFLILSGWVLFLTLFVVLEVTRGFSSGSLRAV
uniref:NADH-ubiquinone oxidoreductase chain 6 n=1 Tax=Dicamptodon aterrimus TaxID=294758 RepID=C9DHE5_DICAT|nr:NADH dehydrogenase subunit 6 [Dicamptodon aterrimus]